jgi:uncharacterized protein YcbX
MPDIHAIYRYPVKGLSPELLLRVELTPGETIPGDRLYELHYFSRVKRSEAPLRIG